MLFATLSLATAADFQALLDDIRQQQDVPGVSAAVVIDGEIIFAGGSGFADLKTQTPMTPDTILYMGSLSKIPTAILALHAVETGQWSLDDRIDAVRFGRGENSSAVTLAHLLTHASGLEREGDFGYWFSGEFPDVASLTEYIERSSLRFVPGTDIRYSNIGYALVGYLAAATLSPDGYSDAIRKTVLEPLGMNSSGVTALPAGIASGYSPPNRVLPNGDRPFAGLGERVGHRWERMYHDARAMSPAFGIHSTASDLARLARFLLGHGNDDLLSQEMRIRMGTRQASGWGLGLKIQRYRGRTINRHDGWFAAHRSHLLLDADRGIAVVVMANGDNASPGRIANALYDAVVGAD